MASWADVVAAGADLPGVEESTWYGTEALKVRGKGFCRLRDEGATLVVPVVDLEDKEALLRSDPDVFFTIPHYDGHASVLVRLEAVERDELAELLTDAWRTRAPKRLAASLETDPNRRFSRAAAGRSRHRARPAR